ncbi:MAG: hypothetical protein ACUVWX_03525 [Kiritimatiellia bacterium]
MGQAQLYLDTALLDSPFLVTYTCLMEHRMCRLVSGLASVAVVLFALRTFSDNKADVDLWGNVGFVKAPAWSPRFDYKNTYSFTEPERPWINHEWGAEYLLYLAYRVGGNLGLLLLKIVLGFVLLSIMNRALRTDCHSGFVRFLFLLLILSTIGYGFSTRPHLFTYLLWAVFLTVLRKGALSNWRFVVLLVTLGLIWANLHGAFFAGVALLAVWSVGEALDWCRHRGKRGLYVAVAGVGPDAILSTHRDSSFSVGIPSRSARATAVLYPALTAVLFGALSLVNPYRWRLWSFVAASAAEWRPYLSEWAPFNPLRLFWEHTDFIALAALTIGSLFCSSRPKRFSALLVIVLTLLAAFAIRRNVPLFAVTVAILAGEHVDAALGSILARVRTVVPIFLQIAALTILILASGFYIVGADKKKFWEIEIPRDRFPTDTVFFMKQMELKGNALVFFDWAEYCIWKLYPDCRQFLDGRFDSAYSRQVIRDYFNFLYCGADWDRALTEYPTDIVLVHAANPVAKRMEKRSGWIAVYTNAISCLFLREDVHREAIARVPAALQEVRRAEAEQALGLYYFP